MSSSYKIAGYLRLSKEDGGIVDDCCVPGLRN